jgi:DNA-binding NtrC family response regulator
MARLLRDRYFAYDHLRGCDLVTGSEVSLDNLPEDAVIEDVPALTELLRNGRDGSPRWVVANARTAAEAAAVVRRAAAAACRNGCVPLLVSVYARLRDALASELAERTLLLMGAFVKDAESAPIALVDAAARSPRPHILLTFRATLIWETACVVREARASYGAPAGVRCAQGSPVTAEVARHIERARRAGEFQRSGRHAAAERLLREVAATLARRNALAPAAEILIALGRLLLERGRAAASDKVFDEAARLAQAGSTGALTLTARLWQGAARLEGGRLTDAESICRAALVGPGLSPTANAWARATLASTLLRQHRLEEATASPLPLPPDDVGGDALVVASIDAAAVNLLLATGDVFHAGQRAQGLLARDALAADPLARLVAWTTHLHVLTAAGDLDAAEQRLREIAALAKEARAPLRTMRARLVWHDALLKAGRLREAQRELKILTRMSRAATPLLRRAVADRTAASGVGGRTGSGIPLPDQSVAVTLIQLAYEEESDERALERLFGRLGQELHPSRIDLVSADVGPVATLMTLGNGLETQLGPRVLESGLVISEEVSAGGREIGVPVRVGSRLVAAVTGRWPVDRQPAAHAVELLTLAGAIAAPRVEGLLVRIREKAQAATSVPELIGVSSAMTELRRAIGRAAKAPFAVLIEGESGVGKELAARALHHLSPRRDHRFCDVNCAALPDELLESELFGHARGAFTGAVVDKPGLFEDADGGTLFLDEVPDLTPRGQAKLLRVLQQQEVRRVGENFGRTVDVRLVTAANRDMRVEAAEDRFRRDLLYRLDVIHIRIPPLRERPEDIAVLAQHLWHAAAARVGSTARLTHGVLSELARYHWPGNVRELHNVMAALAVAAPGRGRVPASLLPAAITGVTSVSSRRLAAARVEFERRCVEVALARAGGSRTRAAKELGLSRQGLLKIMARLGVDASHSRRVDDETMAQQGR